MLSTIGVLVTLPKKEVTFQWLRKQDVVGFGWTIDSYFKSEMVWHVVWAPVKGYSSQ